MASTTTVTVVVVTYDSAPLLPGLVSALSDGLADVGHELVFVDNASADDTCDVVRRLAPTATLVALDRNKGYAAGINVGIAAASPDADAVIVMNPDVRPSRRCVEHLLGALGRDGVGIAVPRLLDADGHLSCSLRRRPTVGRAFGEALLGGTRAGRHPLLGEVVTDVAAYEEPTTADWATGAIMAISQGCLAAVGAWNEDFFLYSEETEFCGRASARGFATRLVPEAEAQHIGGEMGTSPRLWAMQVCNRVRLYERGHGRAATALFRVGVGVNEALRAARGSDVHRAGLRVAGAVASPGGGGASARATARGRDDHPAVAAGVRVLLRPGLVVPQPRPFRLPADDARRRAPARAAGQQHRPAGAAARAQPAPVAPAGPQGRERGKLDVRPLPGNAGFHVMTPLIAAPLRHAAGAGGSTRGWWPPRSRRPSGRWPAGRPSGVVVTIPTAIDVARRLPHSRPRVQPVGPVLGVPRGRRRPHPGPGGDAAGEADQVFYCARAAAGDGAARTGGRARLLDHGVDIDHFRPAADRGRARRRPPPSPAPARLLRRPRRLHRRLRPRCEALATGCPERSSS